MAVRFTGKKQREATTRKKRKILKGPIPLQKRKEYEQYLKNMKCWKLVQLKNKSDAEVFKLHQQAKREIDSFIAIGSKEDEELITDMNRKVLGPEKVIEAEKAQEKEAEIIEKPKEAVNKCCRCRECVFS